MIKIIPPGAQDLEPPALIKIASHGLRGHDLREFRKRAGEELAEHVRKLAFSNGEEPLHVIALGAGEAYGSNRNGDLFERSVCRQYHPTYVKYGHWYRSHRNKDPRRSYGIVKHSNFNEDTQRVELIVALNGTKEAAERNGGLIADKELEKLRSGQSISTSMACSVPFDCCSSCGNKARNRSEYCDEKMCKHGGLKDNMGRVCEDGHQLCAHNPEPKWFDISHVTRNADRISYGLGLDPSLQKSASTNRVVSGAELAEIWGLELPDHTRRQLAGPSACRQYKLAQALAQVERDIRQLPPCPAWLKTGRHVLPGLESWNRADLLPALARIQTVLSVPDFLKLSGLQVAAAEVQPLLRGAFTRLLADPQLEDLLAENPYTCAGDSCSQAAARWAYKQAQVSPPQDWRAALQLARARLIPETTGGQTGAAQQAARAAAQQYALYKLATAEYWACHGLADADLVAALAAGPYLQLDADSSS